MLRNRLLEKLVLPLGDQLLGTSFMRALREVRSFDSLSSQALAALQAQRLELILRHASAYAPFYREYAAPAPADPVEWLKGFPVLSKQVLRQEPDALLTQPAHGLIKKSSSGSSGVQSTVFLTRHELSMQRANFAHWWEWAGYRIGDPMVQTGMQTRRGLVKAGKDLLFQTRYISAFSHRRENIIALLRSLRGKPARHLGGYASSLFVIAQIAEQEGIHDVHFKSAIAWGDKLFAHYRTTIERVFSTRVFETYGCAEGLMIAAQRDTDYLYVMTPGVYLEILDDHGREVPDGQAGHVVVTSLTARAMPLIRYRLGDLAIRLPRSAYPEQREFAYPLLQQVIGRDTDIVRTRGGNSMVVHSFTGIFEHIPEIRQFRVVQRTLDSLEIEYIPGRGFDPAVLDTVRQRIHRGLNEPIALSFRRVAEIPATASGKPQIVLSLLDHADMKKPA